MHTGTCSDSGLGFLTAHGGFELTWAVKVRGKVHKGALALKESQSGKVHKGVLALK